MESLIPIIIGIESTIFIVILTLRDCYTRKLQDRLRNPHHIKNHNNGHRKFGTLDHLAYV